MEQTQAVGTLPRWDMSVIFSGLDSPEFQAASERVLRQIDDLEKLFAEYQIDGPDGRAGPADARAADKAGRILDQLNALLEQVGTVRAYIHSFVSTDSRNAQAQARLSELQERLVRLSQLTTRFTAWIGRQDVERLVQASPVVADHAFFVRRAKVQAEHLMPTELEALTAELNVSSGSAWGKLHGNVTSQLVVPVELEGTVKPLPMSAVRNLAFEPDRSLRQRAYEAELAAWEQTSVPLAAALNSIKGEVNVLARRRGWGSALDAALFQANIDRPTLDALLQATRDAFPDFRRYLKLKAAALNLPRLAWFDLFAPVGRDDRVWEFLEARDFVIAQFGTFSPRLRAVAERAFGENWIDAEPRDGKRDGAFCMWVRGDESRVLSNYKAAYGGMSTLAHELGHAYHNHVKAGRTMLQRETPMTLAETASIFCETIVRQAALKQATPGEQLVILEASLQDNTQVAVDIISRFIFESRLFEQRHSREMSVQELNDLMLDAQSETYGEALDPDKRHPYMWAVKSHYYSTSLSFYNFPYLFGLLFGLGLYRRYEDSPEQFRQGYDDLLSSTGLADAASLAGRFGIDVRTTEFWRSSLDVIRDDIRRFETLVNVKPPID